MTNKGVSITLYDEEENRLVRDNTYYEEEVERLGGVGQIVGSIEPLLTEGERLEVSPFWYE